MEISRTRRWLWTTSDVAWRFLVVAAAAALVVWVLARLRVVVIPLILGAFIASLWSPVVRRMKERGLPPLLATWIATILGIGGLALVGWGVGVAIASRSTELADSLAAGWESILEWLETGPFGLDEDTVAEQIETLIDRIRENAGALLSGALGGAGAVTEIIAGVFFTAVSAFFIIKDGDRAWRWLLGRLPESRRGEVDEAGSVAWATMRRYLAGTAAVGVADALLIGIALAIIGVPLALPLAVLVFFGAFFPFIGAIVTGMIAAVVTLATNGVTDALIVVAVVIAVQQVEGDVLGPLLLGRAVQLHPFVVLVAIAVGVVVAGILGAFLAVPVVGIGVQIVRHLWPEVLAPNPSGAPG
jgi:predicted PurR-regulated permease PerM